MSTFWCSVCHRNTLHIMLKGRWWDWRCGDCHERVIISL